MSNGRWSTFVTYAKFYWLKCQNGNYSLLDFHCKNITIVRMK